MHVHFSTWKFSQGNRFNGHPQVLAGRARVLTLQEFQQGRPFKSHATAAATNKITSHSSIPRVRERDKLEISSSTKIGTTKLCPLHSCATLRITRLVHHRNASIAGIISTIFDRPMAKELMYHPDCNIRQRQKWIIILLAKITEKLSSPVVVQNITDNERRDRNISNDRLIPIKRH